MQDANTPPSDRPQDDGALQRGVRQVGESLHDTIDRMSDPMHEAVNRATNSVHEGVESMTHSVRGVADKIDAKTRCVRELPERAAEELRDIVRSRPLKIVGFAFVLGWLIGRLGADHDPY